MSDPALDILQWYVAMGVDLAIDETAHDRFAEALEAQASPKIPAEKTEDVTASPPARAALPPSASLARGGDLKISAPATTASVALEQAIAQARNMAAAASDLDGLRAALDVFDGCGLKRTAHHLIFADGNPHADVVLIGDAPGADDDRTGQMFAGEAGRLLDLMLGSIGYSRANTYMLNVVPWRPPGNRAPTAQEIAMCLPFLQRHLELLSPKVLICLGAVPLQAVLNVREAVTRVRGQWFELDVRGHKLPALATLHPAFLLRQPAQKKVVWSDLLDVARKWPAAPQLLH
jgi:DNA polymerase